MGHWESPQTSCSVLLGRNRHFCVSAPQLWNWMRWSFEFALWVHGWRQYSWLGLPILCYLWILTLAKQSLSILATAVDWTVSTTTFSVLLVFSHCSGRKCHNSAHTLLCFTWLWHGEWPHMESTFKGQNNASSISGRSQPVLQRRAHLLW